MGRGPRACGLVGGCQQQQRPAWGAPHGPIVCPHDPVDAPWSIRGWFEGLNEPKSGRGHHGLRQHPVGASDVQEELRVHGAVR